MENQNTIYSERQINLLNEIGAKNRFRIKKDMRIQTYPLFISYFIMIGLCIILSLSNPIYYVMLIVLGIFGFIGLIGLALMIRREYKNLLTATDFEVGLFYKRKDPKVIGNAKLKKNGFVPPFIFLAILSLVMTILMILSVLVEKPDYSQLIYETKSVKSVTESRNFIKFEFLDDSKEYHINSIYNDYIDKDLILDNIFVGDHIVIGFLESEANNDISILYLQANGLSYMNETTFNQGYDRNYNYAVVSLVVSAIFLILSIVVVIYYGKIGYDKNARLETINLELTKEEVIRLGNFNLDDIHNSKTITIESKTSDIKRKTITFFALVFLVIDIITIITVQSSDKLFAGLLLSIPAFSFILWTLSCYVSSDVIRDGKFIKQRLFFVKELLIKDIMQVKYNYSKNIYHIMIYNDKNIEIANFVPLEKSSDQLLIEFRRLGVLVQEYE